MYEQLKALINQYIKTNGSRQITGAVLNNVLNEMVNSLGGASGYGGIITPTSQTPANDANIFYIAIQQGNYTAFGITVNAHELAFVKRSGNGWAKDAVPLGSGIVANPQGEATEQLSKIEIDGTVYQNPQGPAGQNAYVHIMYSRLNPSSDLDIHNTFEIGDKYIGICSDNNAIAPTTHASYEWARFVGTSSGGGLSAEEREAIVTLFRMAVYTSDDAEEYIEIIENPSSLKELVSIEATIAPSYIIYSGQNLDDVKEYITVVATYDDGTTDTIAANKYTLSGDISSVGQARLTVSYTEGEITENDYLDVTVTQAPTTYTITNNLINCSTSKPSQTTGYEGNSYSATITASAGYTINGATVVITMGGSDITSTAYNSSTGVISIAEITGDISITVTAVILNLTGIEASFNPPSGTSFAVGSSTDILKQYLTVTPTYSNPDGSSPTEIDDYSLSPSTLSLGVNTITVTCQNQTDTFDVQAINMIHFSNNEFILGTINDRYTPTGGGVVPLDPNIPYCAQNAKRKVYPYFDKEISGGTYRVEVTTNYNIYICLSCYTQHALDKYDIQGVMDMTNSSTTGSIDLWESGYNDNGLLTGGETNVFTVTIPTNSPTNSGTNSSIKCIRALVKNETNTDIQADLNIDVKIYEVTL